MLVSLTEKETEEVRTALNDRICMLEDNAKIEDELKCYTAANSWHMKAYYCRKILVKFSKSEE